MDLKNEIKITADVQYQNSYPAVPILTFCIEYTDFLGKIEADIQYNPKENIWSAGLSRYCGTYEQLEQNDIEMLQRIINSKPYIYASNKVVNFFQYCFENKIDNLGYNFISIEDGKYVVIATEHEDYYVEEFSSLYDSFKYLEYGLVD